METMQAQIQFLQETVSALVAQCTDGDLLDLLYKLLLSSSIT